MPSYSFTSRDGEAFETDREFRLSDDAAARREAIRFAGSLMADDPALLDEGSLVVRALRDGSMVIGTVEVTVNRA